MKTNIDSFTPNPAGIIETKTEIPDENKYIAAK